MFHGTKLVCFTQKNFVKKLSILCKIHKFFHKILYKITKLEYFNNVSQDKLFMFLVFFTIQKTAQQKDRQTAENVKNTLQNRQ